MVDGGVHVERGLVREAAMYGGPTGRKREMGKTLGLVETWGVDIILGD